MPGPGRCRRLSAIAGHQRYLFGLTDTMTGRSTHELQGVRQPPRPERGMTALQAKIDALET
jgi:hypothetical protein